MDITRLEKKLKKQIVAQQDIIEEFLNLLKDENGLKSFLFLGKKGVGKRSLVEKFTSLADKKLYTIDMNIYSGQQDFGNFLYFGKEEEPKIREPLIFNMVKGNPNAIILLKNVSKANKETINALTKLFKTQKAVDFKGREIDFSRTTIIMTSTLGKELVFDNNPKTKAIVKNAARYNIGEELLKNTKKILVFNTLDKQKQKDVVDQILRKIASAYENKNRKIKFDKNISDHVIEKCSDFENQGANAFNDYIYFNLFNKINNYLRVNPNDKLLNVSVEKNTKNSADTVVVENMKKRTR